MFNIFRSIYSKGIEFNAQNFLDEIEADNLTLYQNSPDEIFGIVFEKAVLDSANQVPEWRAWLETEVNKRYGAAQGKSKTELAAERKIAIQHYRSLGLRM